MIDTIPSTAPTLKQSITARPRGRSFVPQVVVAGYGYWGRNLVRVFHQLGVLRMVCEPSGPGADQARQTAPDVPVVADMDAALGDPAVDAVVIATPAETHAALS